MTKGEKISIGLSALFGVLFLVSSVSLDEATSNFASWKEPLFGLGLIFLVLAMLIGIKTLAGRIEKRLAQTVPQSTLSVDHWQRGNGSKSP